LFDLLTEPLVRVVSADGAQLAMTLPGVLAAASRDEIATFPALRAHQRHAWHAFLCQLGALALLRMAHGELWDDEAGWRAGLHALAHDHVQAWSLIAPPDQAALLQPPIPQGLAALRNAIGTPDALDMLVTSRNHDLKAAVMIQAQPDDWLFALVTLQTMEGFLGAGNYGISRMNGGFASRPALGVAPPGGPGAHFRRDVLRLLALRGTTPMSATYVQQGGLSLVWLEAWDGASSLRPEVLDEFYIEICRRVRLIDDHGTIAARAGSSQVARVAPTGGGLTGDPWAPLVGDGDGRKVLTMDARGFNYRRMVKLMWPPPGSASALQSPASTDEPEGIVLLARTLVRGQGKTEGYHERRVPLSRRIKRMAAESATDPVHLAAEQRVEIVGAVERILRLALLALFQGGPVRIDENDKDGRRKTDIFVARFDAAVDVHFFDELWREVEADDPPAERSRWVKLLLVRAGEVLAQADGAAPKASRLRLRARIAAQGVLAGYTARNDLLRPYLERAVDAI
jgi:CRISPR system Cascade subunit CasA